MPKNFREEEERLRFLITKIDAEILRFNDMKEKLESRLDSFNKELKSEGMQPVPVYFQPASGQRDLLDDLTEHILELNKMKNLVAQKLKLVIREEELFEKLQQKHGSSVDLKHLPTGEFEIVVSDSETQQVFSQVQASKKNMAALRKSIQDFTGE